ncbi:MAG: hypothetical protein FWG37_03820 [Clostridia bacterium]|nr:hypothetical protein [Clostridia bacterium]
MQGLKKTVAFGLLMFALFPWGVQSDDPLPEWMLGEAFALSGDVAITVTGYETGSRFRYYPAGGYSSASLRARPGYELCCLYITVDNRSDEDYKTAALLEISLHHGTDYSAMPQNTFYYRTNSGGFAGGATAIRASARVEGCLLFALPVEARRSQRRIYITFQDGEHTYLCELRPATGMLLEESNEVIAS